MLAPSDIVLIVNEAVAFKSEAVSVKVASVPAGTVAPKDCDVKVNVSPTS